MSQDDGCNGNALCHMVFYVMPHDEGCNGNALCLMTLDVI